MPKRVLLIVHWYYPNNSSGAHRPAKYAKYLPEYGWEATVLCADWTPENSSGRYDPVLASQPDPSRTVRVRLGDPSRRLWLRGIRRALGAAFPFRYRVPLGYVRRLRAAAESLLRKEPFDALWSSAPPGTPHYVASQLAKRRALPWVADFRDLPDQYAWSWVVRRQVRAERFFCRPVTSFVATTRVQADMLRSRHRAPVHVILNGFDPDDFPSVQPGRREKFEISFFGKLYFFRDPRPLFEALDWLAEQDKIVLDDFRLCFYGCGEGAIEALAQGYRCARIIESRGRVPHKEMIRLQQSATVLLALKAPAAGGSVPGKLFEYLGARRPILNIPGDGNLVDGILNETGAGVSRADPREIADLLFAWYRKWKSTGTVAYTGNSEAISRYSRREQASELARVLEAVIEVRPER